VLTDETDAENTALVVLAGTIKVAGTATAALLLDRFTLRPPFGAEAFSVTVQESEPGPVINVLLQESESSLGAAVLLVVPVPLRLIDAVGLTAELLLTVSRPVVVPVATGLKCTLKI
jgi:hypothetical protein